MKKLEDIAQILMLINPFNGTVEALKESKNFKDLVLVCEAVEEISSIRFARKEGVVSMIYVMPSIALEQDPSILEKIYGESLKIIPFHELESVGEGIVFNR